MFSVSKSLLTRARMATMASFAWLFAGASLFALPAVAQTYPSKAVRVIVPFAPGGGSDITARQVSQKLSEQLGQQFLVVAQSDP